ncbi:peptidoglycan/LPS O-acetylase OafA/YrhL [Kitasatospora sp. MAP12-15]|uniref:hypothetical protein n=1 Tax=unclassified Kitasatospora TaxID=2633591 RepID=UPI00247659A4|nr:hypothetical protein [Kitasatospora sp. MAP12-44]MDH6109202.1 peptidoglycan/LPS O-acetylase OafA/YrhL [Kitasatospora sp. MAP12-44]
MLGLLAVAGGVPAGRSVPAVDLLLVTTGFLVTFSVLREQLMTGRLALGRRWQRLVKQYALVLLIGLGAALAAASLMGGLPLAKVFRTLVPAVLLQGADWAQFHVQGSLPRAAYDGSWAPAPFGALWPLSVVGQIALCWPLLLAIVLVLLRRSLRALALALGLATAMLLATPFVLPSATWRRLAAHAVFFAGAERLLDLLLGALAASCATIVLRRRGSRQSDCGILAAAGWSLAGAVLLFGLVAVGLRSGADAESWARHLVPAATAELLVTAATALSAAALALVLTVGRGPLRSAFSRPLLVEFGRIGYIVLLIGPLLFWLLHHGWPHFAWYGLVVVGIGFGWLTAICVYYPTGRAAAKPWRTVRAIPLLLAGCLVIGVGAYWLPARAAQMLRPHGPELVLGLGDGLAGDFATALNRSGGTLNGANGVATALSGCGVLSAADGHAGCDGWQQEWRDSLTATEPDAVLLHLGRDAAARTVAGQQQTACAPEYRQQYLARLDSALGLIDSVVPKATVFVLNERLDNSAADPIGTACYNQRIKEFADTHQGKVKLVDLNAELCPVDACRQGTPQGRPFYAGVDGTRLTTDGQALIAPWLEQQVRLPARTAG